MSNELTCGACPQFSLVDGSRGPCEWKVYGNAFTWVCASWKECPARTAQRKAEETLKRLHKDLKACNQRYNKIAVTAGRQRKVLEFYKQGFVDKGVRAKEVLKRNDGLAVRYGEALTVAREALLEVEWHELDPDPYPCYWVCNGCGAQSPNIKERKHEENCTTQKAINKINSVIGEG